MWEFITSNKTAFWLLAVLVTIIVLRFILTRGFDFIIKKYIGENENAASTLNLLKRILVGFVYVVGALLASYAFFEKSVYETLNKNILIVFWIGIVAVVSVVCVALCQRYFSKKITSSSYRDKNDPTTYKFLNYLITFLIYFIGFCLAAMAIPPLRSLAQSALAGAGVLAVIGGFAAQEAISNLVGGLFVVFFKPFRLGDCVKIGSDIIGVVEDLTLRHTVIKDFNNKRIVIPNSVINKENITNYYMGEYKVCEWIKVGISYDSNIDKAIEIMREEATNHPLCIDQRTASDKKNGVPQVNVKVTDLGDSSVNLRAWVWARDYIKGVEMRHDLYKSIKERFDAAGIEIPFPHRTIIVKPNPENVLLQKELEAVA